MKDNQIEQGLEREQIFKYILHMLSCIEEGDSKYLECLYGDMELIKLIDPIVIYYSIKLLKQKDSIMELNLVYQSKNISYIVKSDNPSVNCFIVDQDIFLSNVQQIKLQKKDFERMSQCISVRKIHDTSKYQVVEINELLDIIKKNYTSKNNKVVNFRF